MSITELLKSKGITQAPIYIYALWEKFKTPIDEGAKIYGVTEAEYWQIIDQGLIDHQDMMAKFNFRVGKIKVHRLKKSNYNAQAEALTLAKGKLTYFELAELTGIEDSRMQRICKGQFVASYFEVILIQKATGYDISVHNEAILEEINQTKDN